MERLVGCWMGSGSEDPRWGHRVWVGRRAVLASHEGVEDMGELVTSRQICLLPEGGAGGGGWTDW